MDNCKFEQDDVIEANNIDAQREYRGPQPPYVHNRDRDRYRNSEVAGIGRGIVFFTLLFFFLTF